LNSYIQAVEDGTVEIDEINVGNSTSETTGAVIGSGGDNPTALDMEIRQLLHGDTIPDFWSGSFTECELQGTVDPLDEGADGLDYDAGTGELSTSTILEMDVLLEEATSGYYAFITYTNAQGFHYEYPIHVWRCMIKCGCPIDDLTACSTCSNEEYWAEDEECDDTNFNEEDGCLGDCTITPGWSCTLEEPDMSVCSEDCGAATWEEDRETCDDQNMEDGDGCTDHCRVEPGWTCENSVMPSECFLCGNGIKESLEECDDANEDSLDGCDSTCSIETDWTCVTTSDPSECYICGDGILQDIETCDDGEDTDSAGCEDGCLSGTLDDWSCYDFDEDDSTAMVC